MMMKFITPEGRAYRALYYILHNQCLQSIHKRLKAPLIRLKTVIISTSLVLILRIPVVSAVGVLGGDSSSV
jgi:hypothetical protein